jgi:general stress protein 26
MSYDKVRIKAMVRPPGVALARLIKDMPTAVLTTVSADGSLLGRPMLLLEVDAECLWFLTNASSQKARDVTAERRVNVLFVSADQTRYVSIAGDASIARDAARVDRLWNPTYRAWFPLGRRDPDLTLLSVSARRVRYWMVPSSRLVRVLGAIKALLTGRRYEAGTNGELALPY